MQAILVGVGLLTSLLGSIGSALLLIVANDALKVAGSIARAAAAVAISLGLSTVFVGACLAAIATLSSYLNPPTWLVLPLHFLAPSHLSTVLTVCLTYQVARVVYRKLKEVLLVTVTAL